MGTAPEFRAAVGRGPVVSLLQRGAESRGCGLALFDASGVRVPGVPGPASVRVRGANGVLHLDGPAGAASEAVRVFDRVVGWVVATPAGDVDPGTVRQVACRAAGVLSEFCAREYELNDLSREILAAYEELNLFYELSADLASATDPEAISRVVVRRAVRVIDARRAWLLLLDGSQGLLHVAAAENPPPGDGTTPAGRGAAGRALASRGGEILEDASQLAEVDLAGWERAAKRGLVTVPVIVPGRDDAPVLGVLQISDRRDGAPFSSGDLKLATALANHAAVLVENQRLIGYERELKIARTIQQSLLPSAPPVVPGLEVAASCVPASNVGGDYYDHLVVGNGSLGALVADVSGHNLAAALLQTAARSVLRTEVLAGGGPSQVLGRANRSLHEDLTRSELFLTAWFGVVDPRTRRLSVCDAGHPPALVYRRSAGTVEEIACGGPPFGVDRDAAFEERSTTLGPGDVVVAFTDGLTEARPNGSFDDFGAERLAESLRRVGGASAQEVLDGLLAAVADYAGGGPAADDRSVVVVKLRDGDSR